MPRRPARTTRAHHSAPANPDTVIQMRKPRDELHDPLTYASVGQWYRDYRGYVPIQMAHALDRYIQRTGSTFAAAYSALRGAGAIIEIDYPDESPPVDRRPAMD